MSEPDYRLEWVRKATAKIVAAQTHQMQAMHDARLAGASMRKIAEAAGVSHTQVQRILASWDRNPPEERNLDGTNHWTMHDDPRGIGR